MRNIAIFGNRNRKVTEQVPSMGTFEMEDIPIYCGIIPTREPIFDKSAPENGKNVLVRIKAFSCNYRDKALILSVIKTRVVHSFYVVGSEFVGEVVDVGPEVSCFEKGDWVIGNNHYTGLGRTPSNLIEGIPTNHASKEYQIFHQEKMIKIPENMPIEVAAAFSIGAQTTYSMVRKLNPAPGENILVTSARSNTTLFAIQALKKFDVNIYATSTSDQNAGDLKEMGVKEIIHVNPNENNWMKNPHLQEIILSRGLFNCVIDPFFDLHIGKVIDILAPRGRYITCGFCNQYQGATGKEFQYFGHGLQELIARAMIKNVHIIGNCLGLRGDLENALQDYELGNLDVKIDSVYSSNQIAEYFSRTYTAPDRFGKVIYYYA